MSKIDAEVQTEHLNRRKTDPPESAEAFFDRMSPCYIMLEDIRQRDRAMMLRGARAVLLAVRRAPSWSKAGIIDPEAVVAGIEENDDQV